MQKSFYWQQALIDAVSTPEELLKLLNLDFNLLPAAKIASKNFPLKVTHFFLSLMEKGNVNDPLLRQVLPITDETMSQVGFTDDPLAEKFFNPVSGLLHKYQNRILLTLTNTCAINCRYCFRKHFAYSENNPGKTGWDNAFAYIESNVDINEIILSGGDPLIASDETFKNILTRISRIKHIKRLRIHSRIPIVLPSRITNSFAELLNNAPLKIVLVTHANHPQELSQDLLHSLNTLDSKKITLLNQSVLLKGVNDEAPILVELSEKLFEWGIQPYYLHMLDKVTGTSHFEVDGDKAAALQRQLMQQLSGFLVPKFVYEAAGSPFKLPLHNKTFCTG